MLYQNFGSCHSYSVCARKSSLHTCRPTITKEHKVTEIWSIEHATEQEKNKGKTTHYEFWWPRQQALSLYIYYESLKSVI